MPSTKKLLQAAAGSAGGDNLYVEDVFSTYLVTGTNAAVTVNNGLDLDGEGGMVWVKKRSAAGSHNLYDTERGANNRISSNNTNAQDTKPLDFTSTGFSDFYWDSGVDYTSWSFRKAEKFFDVQTYSGNDVNGRQIAHNLGSTPGLIIIKNLDNSNRWYVWHESFANDDYLFLNETFAKNVGGTFAYLTADPTSTTITIARDGSVNYAGYNYVMYLFASDAGGYGDDGTESIIKCGSVTTDGSGNASVDLGFEPQWCLWKCVDAAGGNEHGNWRINDTMRGWPASSSANAFGSPSTLYANTSGAETISGVDGFIKSATGFGFGQVQANKTYIYVAIRRPMKTPESGTEVFDFISRTGTGSAAVVASPILTDVLLTARPSSNDASYFLDRLRGGLNYLNTTSGAAEGSNSAAITEFANDTIDLGGGLGALNSSGTSYLYYLFQRATGFMDVVAYTGNGASSHALTHNLGVSPELIITKRRDAIGDWRTATNFSASAYSLYKVNEIDGATNINYGAYGMYAAKPTSTTFTVGSGANVNASGGTFVSYLFGTVAGVNKVGSVVHSGTTNVDCGFSAGARFVMAKRADQNSGWFIWDSVRGIVAGNDPYLLLNSTAAEVTNTDYIDPLSSGFTLTSSFTAGTYIFLAIA